jgi:hypothetical protein
MYCGTGSFPLRTELITDLFQSSVSITACVFLTIPRSISVIDLFSKNLSSWRPFIFSYQVIEDQIVCKETVF